MTRIKTDKTEIRQDLDNKSSMVTKRRSGKVAQAASYHYRPEKQDILAINTNRGIKEIPANAAHEKELKEASMKTIIDELLNKAITRRVSKMSDKEVGNYLGRKDKEIDAAYDSSGKVPKMPGEEKKVRALDAKRAEKSDESDMEKCHTHVLGGETEDGLKAKKKEAPKSKGHVFGNDPNDKRGSELEMVKKKEPQAYKSEESDLVKSVNALMEKAVIGYHARAGKFETGTHKNPKAHGKVSTPTLSAERKKEIIEGGRKKALTQAEMGGLHAQAAKIRAEKSLDERTADLAKSLYDVVNHRRFSKIDPDGESKLSNEDQERNAAMHAGIKPKVPKGVTPKGEEVQEKSLDERTSDLHRGFAPEKVGGAVGREYVKNPDSDKAKRVAVKFHSKNANNPEAQSAFSEGMTDEVWAHNLKLAKKSQQDVVNMWQTNSPFITKGARVMPLGPGGEVSTIAKDERRPSGGCTPSYQQTDEKQREVETGKIYRENKAKKRISALKEEQDFGAE